MSGARSGRWGRATFVGLAVVGVKVPLAALGLALIVHEHTQSLAHGAVKRFHEPLLFALEVLGQVGAGGEKVFGIDTLNV